LVSTVRYKLEISLELNDNYSITSRGGWYDFEGGVESTHTYELKAHNNSSENANKRPSKSPRCAADYTRGFTKGQPHISEVTPECRYTRLLAPGNDIRPRGTSTKFT
ncbi:unnamed protein product, partial [Ectocarpus sp. 6 AP-2014]